MDDNGLKIPGMICKSASISAGEVTDRQLAKINKYTLEPLTAEQVFAFKAVLCDNMVDRDFEKFSGKALDDLRRLFVGKTVIKDHRHTADSQIARIFDTELKDSGEMLPDGESYKHLVAHCYMVRTESNKDLIAEIIGGTTFVGGSGTYEGSIAGSLVMVLLSNLLTTLNPTQPVRNVLNAAILILLLVLYNRGKAVRQ